MLRTFATDLLVFYEFSADGNPSWSVRMSGQIEKLETVIAWLETHKDLREDWSLKQLRDTSIAMVHEINPKLKL